MTLRSPRTLPRVDRLEERTQPAFWGVPWADTDLTISLTPDGTSVNGVSSTMQSVLGNQLPNGGWQDAALRAIQTWVVQTPLNVGVVTDGGQAYGVGGATQGDSRFGDIRLAGRPFVGTELAMAVLPDLLGTASGDIYVNTAAAFSAGGSAASYDLYTVLLQETGHTLGVSDSEDKSSVMYSFYDVARTGLSAEDIAAVRAIHGVRPQDRFDAAANNDALTAASVLQFVLPANVPAGADAGDLTTGSTPLVAAGDLTAATDRDSYRVSVPGSAAFTVNVKTAGFSLVRAKVTVYDALENVVGTATAATPGADLSVSLQNPGSGAADYFVRVESAVSDVFGVGGYRLAVGTATDATTRSLVPDSKDGGNLGTLDGGAGWDGVATAAVGADGKSDFTFNTGAGGSLLVAVWGDSAAVPVVQIQGGPPVSLQTLYRDDYSAVYQIPSIADEWDVTLRISAAADSSPLTFGVDLRAAPLAHYDIDTQTLSTEMPQQSYELEVSRDELMRINLTAGTGSSADAAVRLYIYDLDENLVGTVFAQAGETRTLERYLRKGNYIVVVDGGRQSHEAFAGLTFNISGMARTNPVGPKLINPDDRPPPPPPPPPPPRPRNDGPPKFKRVLEFYYQWTYPWIGI